MRALGNRLTLIASFVEAGSRVCDVGCDHGFLSAFLYLRGDVKSVTATDINEKPLKCAERNFKNAGIDGINLVLCDGLDAVGKESVDTVIIAGMGGDVISGIIDRAPFLKSGGMTLILQPMTSVGVLREYLAQNGFCVVKETAVCENKKVYSVMKAVFDGKRRDVSPLEYRIGKLKPEGEENIVYIKRQIELVKESIENLSQVENMAHRLNAAQSLLKELEDILRS